jgi:hypothetical protein
MKTSCRSTRLERCLAESRPPRCFIGPLDAETRGSLLLGEKYYSHPGAFEQCGPLENTLQMLKSLHALVRFNL